MYKKILFITFFVVTFFSLPCLQAQDIRPKVRVGYFYPIDGHFRDIYSQAVLYSFETSFQASKHFYPWASIGLLYTSGFSEKKGDKTQLHVIPFGVGVKYVFGCNAIKPYLGLGMNVAYAHIHNDSPFVTRHQSDYGIGGICKTGCFVQVSQHVFFDFFFDYSFLNINFNYSEVEKEVVKKKANLSGLSVGGGLGYRF